MKPNFPPRRPSNASVSLVAIVAVVAAVGWWWSLICQFPAEGFNFLRLRPSFLLASGLPLYETAHNGPITTWIYGPVLPLLLWPATLASDSASALLVASALNSAVVLLGLGWFCWRWDDRLSLSSRVLVFATSLLILPGSVFQFLQADNAACALAMIGMVTLLGAGDDRKTPLWIAAVAGVCAAASKQIAVTNILAQLIWLFWKRGPWAFGSHALRCLVCAVVAGSFAIALCGWDALWFKMVVVPAKLPFSHVPTRVLADNRTYLLAYVLLLLLAWRGARRNGERMTLAALHGLCAFPLGVAALLRGGGSVNSLHGLFLLTPPVLFSVLHEIVSSDARSASPIRVAWRNVAVWFFVMGIIAMRAPRAAALPHTPRLAPARDAETLAQRYPGAIWFPWNPLATYFVDGRHDHDEDGLYVRQETGLYPTRRLVESGLPPAWRATAMNSAINWDIVPAMIPPGPRKFIAVGDWLLIEHPPRN